jgi:hypothetical protein
MPPGIAPAPPGSSAPHSVAAVIGGVGATATTVTVQVGHWLARAARTAGLLG